ncbi:MAG: stage II sporulation protein R [Firmicutes bacterium]|nr:stage II sporulation protein R [Bacillota bacterium]MCL1944955.1 stage II sporulation protein R [Bacillota bacterium]MCL1954234.1 stage II sporulation protein R [Bacillota bacterium]
MIKSKKIFCIVVVCIVVGLLISLVIPKKSTMSTELIRIHIIANSDSEEDQRVKLLVRDEITSRLTDNLKNVNDRQQAYTALQELQDDILTWSDDVLNNQGKEYKSSVSLDNEFFPTRIYEGIVVDSGYYDALLITLGNGDGKNWWCVVYPPLCFLTDLPSDYWEYRSFLLEWWNNFWN